MNTAVESVEFCRRCGSAIRRQAVEKFETATGARVAFHEGCWRLIEESSADRVAREITDRNRRDRGLE